MSDFEKSLNESKKLLMNDELVQEYFHLKEAFQNDSELQKLDQKVRTHQKRMCENEKNDVIYFGEKKIYEEKSNEFNNHPIVINLLAVKKEVQELLKQVKGVLE